MVVVCASIGTQTQEKEVLCKATFPKWENSFHSSQEAHTAIFIVYRCNHMDKQKINAHRANMAVVLATV